MLLNRSAYSWSSVAIGGTEGTLVPARIAEVGFGGASTIATATADADASVRLRVRVASRDGNEPLAAGMPVTLSLPSDACRVVPL